LRLSISRVKSILGTVRVPSDKSLTHRAYMFGAIASGASRVKSPLRGEDCESTLRCLSALGLRAEWESEDVVVLRPAENWRQPSEDLDCGNSGTTIRLMSGLVASRSICARFTGDESLSRRPMGRIATPLRAMGAIVEGDRPPLTVRGSDRLAGIRYESPVASAQIKSCTLLAGLRAMGETTVTEPSLSRDHTERMLTSMGASIQVKRELCSVTVKPSDHLSPFSFAVPADVSSAAFLMVAAALVERGELLFTDLSVNPTRTGILDVLRAAGVEVNYLETRDELGEPVANVRIGAASSLRPFSISGDLVPRLIDEIPVLAVLATQCHGTSVIREAGELRVKESDRIDQMATGLRAMGAEVDTFEDGMAITGPTSLSATHIDAHGDHRIAMAFAVAGLVADGVTEIDGAESIATSFPGFESELGRISNV
jgi:3-phosphoshikimate 1-carboxyvinyltransferase